MKVENIFKNKSFTFSKWQDDLSVNIALPTSLMPAGSVTAMFSPEDAAKMRDWLNEHVVNEEVREVQTVTKTIVKVV